MPSNILNKFSLYKKTCFILGGCGLIGSEIIKTFSKFNSKIIILDINKNKANIIIKKFNKNKKFIFFEEFDCHLENDLIYKFPKILEKYGCPNVFVNCSHPTPKDLKYKTFKNLKKNILDDYVKVQMNSYAWLARLTAEEMSKKGISGSIILFASIYGLVGQDLNVYKGTTMKESVPYSLIKGGIINYVRQMASYYGKNNIRINCISPGGLKGHVKDHGNNQEQKFLKNYSKKVPLARMGEASEVALCTLFLASEASSYITGHNLVIDGGWTII